MPPPPSPVLGRPHFKGNFPRTCTMAEADDPFSALYAFPLRPYPHTICGMLPGDLRHDIRIHLAQTPGLGPRFFLPDFHIRHLLVLAFACHNNLSPPIIISFPVFAAPRLWGCARITKGLHRLANDRALGPISPCTPPCLPGGFPQSKDLHLVTAVAHQVVFH